MKVLGYKDRVSMAQSRPVMAAAQSSVDSQAAAVRANMLPNQLLALKGDMASASVEPAKSELAVKKAGAGAAEAMGRNAAELKMRMAYAVAEQARNTAAVLKAAEAWHLEKQRDLDASAVMAASNEWRNVMLDYEVNPETGYKNTRQLGGAVNLLNDTQAKLNDTEKELSRRLSNDIQRKAFSQFISQNRSAVEGNAARYEAQQIRENTVAVTKETVASCIASAVEHPEDFEIYFNTARGAVLDGIKNTDEATKLREVGRLRSDFQSAVIADVAAKDPVKAEAYFNAVRGELSFEVREQIGSAVRKAALPVKAQALYKQAGGDYAEAMDWISKNVDEADKKAFRGEFQSYFSDMESVKRESYQKTRDELAGIYLKTGGLKGVSLQTLVDTGKLDADGAMVWQNRLEADKERRIAQAERAENARFREVYKQDQLFKLSLRGKPPIVQELMIAEREYGVPRERFVKNYEDAVKKLKNGDFTYDDFANMKAYGELTPMFETNLERLMKEREASPREVAIRLNASSEFERKMKALGVKDENYILRDRFNFEYEEMRSRDGKPPTLSETAKIMDVILTPDVVGQTQTWWGSTKDLIVRRGEVPPSAEKGRDGRYHLKDSGQTLYFPGDTMQPMKNSNPAAGRPSIAR